jgi:tetratricopeptide (TPR) repeat protein
LSDDFDGLFGEAAALEREYKWLEAADVHGRALAAVEEEDLLKRGEAQERVGYCLLRAAVQSESHGEFRERIQRVVEAYDKSAKFYARSDDPKRSQAKMSHCGALISYIGFWLSDDTDTKRKLLDECLRLEKESLKAYDGAGDRAGSGRACVALANFLSNRLDLEVVTREREKTLDEALSFGERAIKIFSENGDEHGLAEAYCITSINCYDGAMSYSSEKKIKDCERKAFDYVKNAISISKKLGDMFLLGRSTFSLGFIEVDLGAGSQASYEHFKEALPYSEETQDYRLLSEVYDGLAYTTHWGSFEDLDSHREISRLCVGYVSEAISCSALVDYGRGIPHAYISLGYCYEDLGIREVEFETRLELLEKAVLACREGLEHAQLTGSTHATYHLYATLALTLSSLSTVKTGMEKKRILEEAVTVGEQYVSYVDQLRPYFMWVRAAGQNIFANIYLELGKLEENAERRRELLEKSVSHKETGISFVQRHIASLPPRIEVFARQGVFQTELGEILYHLYQTTADKKELGKIIKTHKKSIQNYEKADLVSRVAEAYWKTAVAHDQLGEYSESASNFESASKQYELSAQSIPELKKFYMDHATYMQAWSEIERARHHHSEKRYGEAKEHYVKAAELHESTERWSYLTPNYRAWATLEEAEGLSRGEQTQEAKELFEETARLFAEAEETIKAGQDAIKDDEEAQMAEKLMQASGTRRQYCLGRTAMEEARTLDRQGDHTASARKYGQAEQSFRGVIDSMEQESDRQELKPIVLLCQAWQKTMMAEARASPSLYGEAAELFMQAKDHAIDQSTSLLSQAHSSFCKALEVGTEFELTRETALYTTAKRHIEAATSCYLRAGYQSASEYTTATNRLLDAYMYMYGAQTETDPGQKARLYQLAERLLQSSAGSYIKAKHPEKSEEVRRVLEKIKEEKQIAMALSEILHAPSVVATTSSFSTPTPTHERAVGLERFESADIQANMIVRGREMKVGEDLNLEIELVNAGKAPAQLIKVEEIIPEGFEILQAPDTCRVEDSYLDMKGRTLNPLKTAELRLVLRPRDKGTYDLSPRILYLDGSGKYRSHEPEPATITVTELGISGWLRGPTR